MEHHRHCQQTESILALFHSALGLGKLLKPAKGQLAALRLSACKAPIDFWKTSEALCAGCGASARCMIRVPGQAPTPTSLRAEPKQPCGGAREQGSTCALLGQAACQEDSLGPAGQHRAGCKLGLNKWQAYC